MWSSLGHSRYILFVSSHRPSAPLGTHIRAPSHPLFSPLPFPFSTVGLLPSLRHISLRHLRDEEFNDNHRCIIIRTNEFYDEFKCVQTWLIEVIFCLKWVELLEFLFSYSSKWRIFYDNRRCIIIFFLW